MPTKLKTEVSAAQQLLLKKRDIQQDSYSAAVRAEAALKAKDADVKKIATDFYATVRSSRARKYMFRLSDGVEGEKELLQLRIAIVKAFTTDTTAVLDNLAKLVR